MNLRPQLRRALVTASTIGLVFVGCGGGGSGGGGGGGVGNGGGTPPTMPPSPRPTAVPSNTPSLPSYGFAVSGSTVRGYGTPPAGTSVRFAAAVGTNDAITIDPGADLIAYCDNTKTASAATSCSNSASGVLEVTAGSLVNHGKLESYPSEPKPGANYAQTGNVVTVLAGSQTATMIDNFGEIGDESGKPAFYGPVGYYGQGPSAGILTLGPATIVNEAGATVGGYNAIFTKSSGSIDNRGVIFGVNDGILSGVPVTNEQGAGIVTGIMGYASIHEYGPVHSEGYILGSDFGVLISGGDLDDTGGPIVAHVTDVGGHAVYGGEIEAIPRGATTPAPLTAPVGTAVLGAAAIEFDADSRTVTLRDRVANSTTYLPIVGGVIEGGFNGNEANHSAHETHNVVDFEFPDVSASSLQAFTTALRSLRQTTASGTFYTGTATIDVGQTTYSYTFANLASIRLNGNAI